jgi:hypothetical protein
MDSFRGLCRLTNFHVGSLETNTRALALTSIRLGRVSQGHTAHGAHRRGRKRDVVYGRRRMATTR